MQSEIRQLILSCVSILVSILSSFTFHLTVDCFKHSFFHYNFRILCLPPKQLMQELITFCNQDIMKFCLNIMYSPEVQTRRNSLKVNIKMKLCVPTELKVLKYCARKFVVFGESRKSDIYCGMDQWKIEHISVWFLKTFYFTVFS